MPKRKAEEMDKYAHPKTRDAFDDVNTFLVYYLKHIVYRWGNDEVRIHLKPLFRQLKNKTLPTPMRDTLDRIVSCLEKKSYSAASEAYMELSIGNAAWPMGVSHMSIHARRARDRIDADRITHLLDDEKQRKAVQAVKRIISYCQRTCLA